MHYPLNEIRNAQSKVYAEGKTALKMVVSREDTRRNGVGIILQPDLQENVIQVQYISARLLGLKLLKHKGVWHVISTFITQQGCREEKSEFRGRLDEYIGMFSISELLVASGSVNVRLGDGFEGI
ncbi:uncharacterized protein [Palaemon carinicauda]|uniref:uncharacterized protein n=1 Tax=Palaemon carinicauda TaxID=392227 RepID=UPI0035B5832E